MAHRNRSQAISVSSITTILSEVSIVGDRTPGDGTDESGDGCFSIFDSDEDGDADLIFGDEFIADDNEDVPEELKFNGLFVGSLFPSYSHQRIDSESSDSSMSSTESLVAMSNVCNTTLSNTTTIAIPGDKSDNDLFIAFSPESQMIILPWSPEENKRNEQAMKDKEELERQVTDANNRWNVAMAIQEPRKKKISVTFAEAPQVIIFDPQDAPTNIV